MLNEIQSVERQSLFEYLHHPMNPHNPFYTSAAKRCIELFLDYTENKKETQDFIGWFKLRNLYSCTAQYGLARSTVYHSPGHNKILQDMASAYQELYVRVRQITQSNLWDTI